MSGVKWLLHRWLAGVPAGGQLMQSLLLESFIDVAEAVRLGRRYSLLRYVNLTPEIAFLPSLNSLIILTSLIYSDHIQMNNCKVSEAIQYLNRSIRFCQSWSACDGYRKLIHTTNATRPSGWTSRLGKRRVNRVEASILAKRLWFKLGMGFRQGLGHPNVRYGRDCTETGRCEQGRLAEACMEHSLFLLRLLT